MTFFVHKTTSRLARTLKIGTGKIFCTRNPKITFKTSKNLLLLSYCTSLPKFEFRDDQASKKYVALLENENFLFLCVLHSLNFPSSKNKVLFFFHLLTICLQKQAFFSRRDAFHWRISKLNQKHQLLKFITTFIFHVAIVNLMHRQKIRSYL